jgi:membrane-associated protein
MFDPVTIIKTVGLLGIFLVICAESGVFFGFFLPGDTLLFSAGIFASQGFFSLPLLIIGCSVAAIIGDNIGYWTGKKMGRGLFEKDASFFFNKDRVYEAEHFYKKHGSITIIAARFIPVIRTFAPIIAGVASMRYKTFLIYNIVGGVLWALFVPMVGYYFGGLIPNPDKYLLPIAIIVIGCSFLIPVIMKVVYHSLTRKK